MSVIVRVILVIVDADWRSALEGKGANAGSRARICGAGGQHTGDWWKPEQGMVEDLLQALGLGEEPGTEGTV